MKNWMKWLLLFGVIFGLAGCATPYDGMSLDDAAYQAVNERDLDALVGFVNKGANPNKPSLLVRTATQQGWDGVSAMRFLVGKGANLHFRDEFGRTLLHFNIENRSMLDYLLSQKMNINALSNDGKTPYLAAVARYGQYGSMALALEQRGADVNAGRHSAILLNSTYEEQKKKQEADAAIYREQQAKKQSAIDAIQAESALDRQRAEQASKAYQDEVKKSKATLDAMEADRQRRMYGGMNCITGDTRPGCR